jgi:UDP-N-acetylbacillosamine N-acetyltransferase
MREFIILGAGGQARDIASWIINTYDEEPLDITLLQEDGDNVFSYREPHCPVSDDWTERCGKSFLVGVADPKLKAILVTKAISFGMRPGSPFISKLAFVFNHLKVGLGAAVGPGGYIGPGAVVERYCTLNVGAMIGHDSVLGAYTTCLPNSCISGNCKIGSWCTIGAGSSIIENIRIAPNTIVGLGACVINDIQESGSTLIGVPAHAVYR